MKIVHVCQHFLPWIGYQEYYLAREQLRLGHDVTVVSSNRRWPGGSYSVLEEPGTSRDMPCGSSLESGIPTIRLPVVAEPLAGRLVLGGLRRCLYQLAPEVVLCHGYLLPLTFLVASAQQELGFRLLVDEHQLPSQAVPGRIHKLMRRTVARVARHAILPRVSHLVAVARGAQTWLVQEYGLPGERIHYIPLGVDGDLFKPDANAGLALRRELGIGADTFVAAYSGKIAPYKRVDALVQAAAHLADVDIAVVLVGHGERSYLAELTRLAGKEGVRLIIHNAVPPPRLAQFFCAADVCVWPADCTISHLEAAACGTPIIVPEDPGVADRIEAGNGLAVPAGDMGAIAKALTRLQRAPDLRRQMGRRGVEATRVRYGWRAVAVAFDALCRDSTQPVSTLSATEALG